MIISLTNRIDVETIVFEYDFFERKKRGNDIATVNSRFDA